MNTHDLLFYLSLRYSAQQSNSGMPAPSPFFLCLSLLCSSLLFFPSAARGQTFQEVDRGTAFPDGAPVFMGSGGSMTWVDVDQDGLLDVFFLGTHRPMFTRVSLLFHNDGNWTFSEITDQAFPDGSLPSAITGQARWADFNQDGFPDLLVFSSESNTDKFVKVWKNNQGANFTEVTTEMLPALSVCQSSWCWLEWGDFDGDDLVDLFLSVRSDAKTVFLNDGNDPTSFTTEVDVTSAFSGAYHSYVGEVRVADFDGDGDDDIFWVMNSAVKLYRSNGDGSFTDATNSLIAEGSPSLPALHEGGADWGDINGDQRLDFVVCGQAGSAYSAVFVQTKEGQFRAATTELFPGGLLPQVSPCSARFVDFDGDDLLDLAITGTADSVQRGGLLRNRGSWFEDVTNLEFDGDQVPLLYFMIGHIAWVDVDGNRSPDFSAMDQYDEGVGFQLWRNTRSFLEDDSSSSSAFSESSFSADASSSSSHEESDESESSSASLSFHRMTMW